MALSIGKASAVLFLSLLAAGELRAEDAATPGAVFEEVPTIHCLGVRWTVKGDANANATIAVAYRKAGTDAWLDGLPLFRTRPNPHPENTSKIHTVAGGWVFAGSIVDLEPETAYEVRLKLSDPDGGADEKTLSMTTWREPRQPKDMTVYHVVPGHGGGSGSEADPFKGVAAAGAAAKPGALFLLHKGVYVKDDCDKNTWVLSKSGTAELPIIFRGAGDGEAVLDGGGDHKTEGRLVSANRTKYIWFEDLSLRNRQWGIVAHEGSHWTIRRCRFENVTHGFTAHNAGYDVAQHHFIADNYFTGATTWPRTKGIEPYAAATMTGAGHEFCYNRIEHMGDGFHSIQHGNISACDFYGNDIFASTDDGLETDYTDFNVRVFRNRIVNVIHGVTAQPSHGGPVYIFRNFIYNATYSPFKLNNHTSGVLLFHNTCLRAGDCFKTVNSGETVTNVTTRNNLLLGTGGYGYYSIGKMAHCDFDHDGFGGYTGPFLKWNGRNYKTPAEAKQAGAAYTGSGPVAVDPKSCFASGLLPPADPNTAYAAKDLDFRLAKDSGAVDQGVPLPNFAANAKGAPDLGALELGEAFPHVGPRDAGKTQAMSPNSK